MSSTLPEANPCCTPCEEPTSVAVPGPQGAAGAAGTNGTDGVDAFTTTTADFAMPAEGANVSITVADSTWMVPNQIIYIQNCGWMEVQSKADSTHVTAQNIENTASGTYSDNVAPATNVVSGQYVSPGGLQGPIGAAAAGTAPDDATYWVSTPDGDLSAEVDFSAKATGLVQNTTGTGVPVIRTVGVADDDIVEVDDAAGLVNGETCFATANGIETKTAAQTRTALGLGTSAVEDVGVSDDDMVQVDDAAGLTSGEYCKATANGIESISVAAVQAELGITKRTVNTIAVSTVVTTSYDVILCNAAGGAVTVTLPTAIGNSGKTFVVKKIDAGALQVAAAPILGQTIDGAAAWTTNIQYTAVEIISDGANWHII